LPRANTSSLGGAAGSDLRSRASIYFRFSSLLDLHVAMPYPSALITNSSQNYLQALHPHMFTSESLRVIWPTMCSLRLPVTRSGLHSLSETTSYITPRLRTKFGEWAFSISGPASWNSISAELRNIPDTSVFKNKLTTYLFELR